MNWLEHQARAHPDAVALVEDQQVLTYRDLAHRAGRQAARLKSLGIAAGDRVGVQQPTGLDAAIAIHALLWVGAVIVPIHPRTTAAEAAEMARRAECHSVLTGLDSGDALEPSHPAASDRTLDAPTVLAFTSGTTGRPKPVTLTAGNLFSSAAASAFNLGVRPDDRWLCCLPLAHVGGLMVLVRSLLYGTSVHLLEPFDAERVAALFAGGSMTHGSLVPTQLRRILERVDEDWRPDPRLRAVLIGGGPAVGDELARARDIGLPVLGTYGMTEAASQLTTAPLGQPPEKLGSAGLPLAGVTLQVRREAETFEADAGGAIWARGPMIGDSPGVDDDGWLDTGDFGRIDDDGYLWIDARREDRIVSGGENVDPVEVERALIDAPKVTDCAVVGVADEEWGQKVVAFVVLAGDYEPGEDHCDSSPKRLTDRLTDHCRRRLAPYKVPKTWVVVKELPRTATGKLRRRDLIESLEDRTASETCRGSNKDTGPDR